MQNSFSILGAAINFQFVSSDYRHSFQGQEKDDEIKGEGNSMNYKYRMHDTRIGRFFAVDKLSGHYSGKSPYDFCANRVLDCIESEGLSVEPVVRKNGVVNIGFHSQNAAYKDPYTGLGHYKVQEGSSYIKPLADIVLKTLTATDIEIAGGRFVVLHACLGGAPIYSNDGKVEQSSIAEDLSLEIGGIVVGADTPVWQTGNSNDGDTTPAFVSGDENSLNPSNSEPGQKQGKTGNWLVYNKGVLIAVYSGNWEPTSQMSQSDALRKTLTYTVIADELEFRTSPDANNFADIKLKKGQTFTLTGNVEGGLAEFITSDGITGWTSTSPSEVTYTYDRANASVGGNASSGGNSLSGSPSNSSGGGSSGGTSSGSGKGKSL